MEHILGPLLVIALSAAAIAQLIVAPKSWGTRAFYRQTWALLTRDPQRDRSLDRRLAWSNGIGITALLSVLAYVLVYG